MWSELLYHALHIHVDLFLCYVIFYTYNFCFFNRLRCQRYNLPLKTTLFIKGDLCESEDNFHCLQYDKFAVNKNHDIN